MFYFFSEDGGSDQITLSAEESRHCTRVLRKAIGDEIHVLNGKGRCDRYRIGSMRKEVEAVFDENVNQEDRPGHFLEVVVSPTKKMDRMEWMTEKLVEIGVHRLVFIDTANSERHYLKPDRLHKKAVSALKQSGNLWFPEFITEGSFEEIIKGCNSDFKGVAHCVDDEKRNLNSEVLANSHSSTVLIGPEGDFSPQEISLAIHAGFVPLSLGESRLRTETAAVVACTLINHFCVSLKNG